MEPMQQAVFAVYILMHVVFTPLDEGETVKYNHDVVFSIMKDGLEKLACWAKYSSYTATNNIPTILRGKELV